MCRKEAEVTCSHRPRPEREKRSEIIKENQREIKEKSSKIKEKSDIFSSEQQYV